MRRLLGLYPRGRHDEGGAQRFARNEEPLAAGERLLYKFAQALVASPKIDRELVAVIAAYPPVSDIKGRSLQVGDRLPAALTRQLDALRERLG